MSKLINNKNIIFEPLARVLLMTYFDKENRERPLFSQFSLIRHYIDSFSDNRIYEFAYDTDLPFTYIYQVYLNKDLKLYLKNIKI